MSAYVIFDVEIRDMTAYQEFMKGVKPALEAAGAAYVDVAREPPSKGGGGAHLERLLSDPDNPRPAFAPPFLVDGDITVGQTAAIQIGRAHV